ncbi:MAG TPA: hypothetical protein VG756_06685 [Pseudonocardiaceae bacterium]|nr:hypothetical protein [Pseudonocardiaceae bacterium]
MDVSVELDTGQQDSEELEEPIGNMLNHNLVQALMASATLVPADLALLDGWDYESFSPARRELSRAAWSVR